MSIDSSEAKRQMRQLRRFFYVSGFADFVGFSAISIGSLALFPSKYGVLLSLCIAIPLLLWHQSYVWRRMRCPSCSESLSDSDGISLYAKKCEHCNVELR